MSTQDIPDNKLDDFFKKSLEEPHIAFEEEAWIKMEQKLNNAASQQNFFRRLFYCLLLLLGMSTSITSWYITDLKEFTALHVTNQVEKLIDQKEAAIENPANTDNSIAKYTNPAAGLATDKGIAAPDANKLRNPLSVPAEVTGKSPSEENLSGSPELHANSAKIQADRSTNDSDTQNGLSNKKAPVSQPEKSAVGQGNKRPIKNQAKSSFPATYPANTSPIAKTRVNAKKEPLPAKETIAQNRDEKTAIKNAPKANANLFPLRENQEKDIVMKGIQAHRAIHSALIAFLAGSSIKLFDIQNPSLMALSGQLSGNKTAALKDTSYKHTLAKPRFRPGFGAGIVFSPDMSSVGFSNWDMPGSNAGFFIEYYLSKKWSFSTGAIYSTKIYKAAGKDYAPPKGFWGAYKVWPEEVDANCKVLDIPLNVRYNIVNREKFNVFVVTGLSSYFMLREDYRYTYNHYVDDRYLKKSWRTKNEFKHFFSVVNISAGYERKLSSRFSVQAEPYLKLPLAGVGFGKIKLLSTGAFFSLKYKL